MKKERFLFLSLICCLFLSGCGYKDIDNRYFVVGLGIDIPENEEMKYKVTLKLAIPSAQIKAGENEFVLEREEAESLAEAVRLIKSRVNKELDFGHAKSILLGDGIVKQYVKDELEWLMRRRDIQKIAWIMNASPSADEILKLKPKSERIPGNTLFLMFGENGTETAYIHPKFLFEFYREMKNEGVSAVLPTVVKDKDDELMAVKGAVIFDNEKESLRLSKEEAMLYNALCKGEDKSAFRIKADDYFFVISTDTIKGTYKINNGNKKSPYVDFKVNIIGTLEESDKNLSNEHFERYNRLAEKQFEDEVKKLLEKFRENGVDPFGFGMKYRANHFNNDTELKEWEELYPKIEFKVKADVKIKGTGVIE
ncbi:Ger(x)C family spore germination protein [Bacillus sp. 31A1R]|uniref:Ger(X)C family spore germination protein n=1 Tax=Robertmurraya mangrovi TaxID=3098077 RepID=A0ABU5ITM3_9BACI|nr:Ger(x)C family spore germination protein [Bacillus sp. 31A1R]MDZ5470481.1 Ger(x)C family spore germination protein [Bacillus sp. 31A1R]